LRCKRLCCLLATPAKKPRGYYDHGEDFELEDQVAVLVELFAKTRRRPIGEISDYDLFGWRQSFRIMLGHHNIHTRTSSSLVVDAQADRRLELDYGRYSAPYNLHRDGEWGHILASVQLAQMREEMFTDRRPTPKPRRRWDDEWDL
jgi:hypothetical protein